MFSNYFSVILRNLWKYRAFSAINVLGLVIGITCCLLILLFVQYEFSYDRFHDKAERIYRISLHGVLAGNEINATTSPYPMAATLVREYPEVETAARYRRFFQDVLVSVENFQYREVEVFHADPELLEIFSFEFLAGDKTTALTQPNSIVVSETMAGKYFPGESALGKTLTFNNQTDYQITGVMVDVPENSHTHPDILVSFTSDSQHDSPVWISNNIQTYLLVRPGTDQANLETKLEDLIPKYIAPEIEQALGASLEDFLGSGGRYGFGLQPLNSIHLFSDMQGEIEPPGSASYVYTFLAVAILVLLLACTNFMNLSTARSSTRAKEIGVRKTLGANRGQILTQFLVESFIITLIALLISLPLVFVLLEPFNVLTDKTMSLGSIIGFDTLPLLLLFTLIVGILSGSYPALFLSSFHPQLVLQGKLSKASKSSRFRSSLVIFQFVMSVTIVASTLLVYNQLDYMRNKPLGFEKDNTLIIHRVGTLGNGLAAFRQQIESLPGVINVASTVHVPGTGPDQNVYVLEGQPMTDSKAINRYSVGLNFIETLGMELLSGREFSEEFGSDRDSYIINEAAAREFGIENPTEHNLLEPAPDGMRSGPIIGVIADFHYQSLHQEIQPMLFAYRENARFIVVRIRPDDIQQTIDYLESSWRETTQGEPFEYSFLAEDFENLHEGDQRLGELFAGFSILAVVIASLGLYGLASFSIEQRSKEIGIRKTLGASVTDIMILISKEFMLTVLWAIVIAIPITYFAMNEWLQLFSYRTDISLLAFLVAGLLALVVAFVTISLESVKAALLNPVLALRNE